MQSSFVKADSGGGGTTSLSAAFVGFSTVCSAACLLGGDLGLGLGFPLGAVLGQLKRLTIAVRMLRLRFVRLRFNFVCVCGLAEF